MKLKHLPNNLTEMLKLVYTSQCPVHEGVITNTSHLRKEHGVDVDIPQILKDFQLKANKKLINRQVQFIINTLKVIRNATGKKPGPKPSIEPKETHPKNKP